MAFNTKATQTKRQRERNRQENHQVKSEKREIRKEKRRERALNPNETGEDPDLIGIRPGPQPIAE
jgi:hypothetical protein